MLPHPMSALAVSETARPLTAHSKAKSVANVSPMTSAEIMSPCSALQRLARWTTSLLLFFCFAWRLPEDFREG